LAEEAASWVKKHLGAEYAWPGNFRELEQCVRNILIRREYRPLGEPGGGGALENALDDIRTGALTAEELLEFYCTRVHAQTGNYSRSARRLGLDRRTVKSKINKKLLEELSG
jgi:transcriptional regulator of acetoin/glycerol metabolism